MAWAVSEESEDIASSLLLPDATSVKLGGVF